MTTLRELIKSPSKLARDLGLTPNAVVLWIRNNAIPPKRAHKVVEALDIEMRDILPFINYSKTRALPSIQKNKGDFEQLYLAYQGLPYKTTLPEKTVHVTLGKWGDRFPLLYTTLHELHDKKIDLEEAATRLGLSKSTIHGLRRRYGLNPKLDKKPKIQAKKPTKVEKLAAIEAISGRFTAVSAADHFKVNLRTLHRHIAAILRPNTLNEISHWSLSFRNALAWELEHEKPRYSAAWWSLSVGKGLLMKKRPSRVKPPENYRTASIRELLILWLQGEPLEDIAARRGGEPAVLHHLFETELAQFGLESAPSLTVHHQSAAAEIIHSHMSHFRSRAAVGVQPKEPLYE